MAEAGLKAEGLTQQRRALAWGLAAALAVGLLSTTRVFWGFEERAIGVAIGLNPRARRACALNVIELTGPDYQRWNGRISREQTSRLVAALSAAGAGVIGFDIAYSVPDFKGPEVDALFERTLLAHGRIVTGVSVYEEAADPGAERLPLEWTVPVGPAPAWVAKQFVRPFGKVGEVGYLGAFSLGKGESGVLRSVFPLVEAGGQRMPSLGLAMWLVANDLPYTALVQRPDRLELPGLVIPLSPRGDVPYRWEERRFGLWTLLQVYDRIDPATGLLDAETAAAFRGKHVLVGGAWDVVADTGPVATGALRPLVEAHAQFFCDLLARRPMRDAPRWGGLLTALFAGLLLSVAALTLSTARSLAALLALVAATAWGLDLSMRAGVYLGPLTPLLAGAVAWAGATAGRLQSREKERRVLRDAFGAYMDPAMFERILAAPEEHLSLSGAKKKLTILFSDLVGFTALTNQLGAETIVSLLREYTEAMTRIVVGHGGRVDKIMGDGMLAVFGDPVDLEDHPGAAALTALAMRDQLAQLNVRWVAAGLAPIACRVGIATGEVFVGNIGSRQSKLEYTVLGAAVNLASRLEGRAPPGCVLVSKETHARCSKAFEFAPAPLLQLKGFEGGQESWLLMGLKADSSSLRRHARVEVSCPVRVRARATEWVDGVATNASTGGLFVQSPLDVPAGSELELALLGQGAPEQTFKAKVRWRGAGEGDLVGLGLEVEGLQQHLGAVFGLERRKGR